MKERFTKCYGNSFYVREVKHGWWGSWKIVRVGLLPVLYERLPGGTYKQFEPLTD